MRGEDDSQEEGKVGKSRILFLNLSLNGPHLLGAPRCLGEGPGSFSPRKLQLRELLLGKNLRQNQVEFPWNVSFGAHGGAGLLGKSVGDRRLGGKNWREVGGKCECLMLRWI